MAYRTLEEKFLADFEELERENEALRAKVQELLETVAETPKGNRLIENMVRDEGRKKVFEKYTVSSWNEPSTEGYDYDEWCIRYIAHDYCDEPKLPKGISVNEFIDYFEAEFSAAFDAKFEEEQAEKEGKSWDFDRRRTC